MINIVFENVKFPSKTLYIYMTSGSGSPNYYYPKITEFGKFIIGNDDSENEMIFFPGSHTLKFKMETLADYDAVLTSLQSDGATIMMLEDNILGDIYFKADSEPLGIEGDPILQVISITFYDDYKNLSEQYTLPTIPIPPVYTKFEDIIKNSLGVDYVTFEWITDFRFKYYDGGVDYECTLADVAIVEGSRFSRYECLSGVNFEYYTKGDVLKSILNNLASTAVMGLNRIFTIIPRMYNGGTPITVLKEECNKNRFKTIFSKKYAGLRVDLKKTGVEYVEFKSGEVINKTDTAGNNTYELVNADEVETIYVFVGVSSDDQLTITPSGYTTTIVRLDSGGTEYPIKINEVKYKLTDSTFSYETSLIEHIVEIIWANIGGVLRKYMVTKTGIDYNFSQKFYVEGETNKFRPIKMEYDLVNDSTEITLIECPTVTAQAETKYSCDGTPL